MGKVCMQSLQSMLQKQIPSPAFSSFVFPTLSMFANTCQDCAITKPFGEYRNRGIKYDVT